MRVSVRADETHIRIFVHDSGIGISDSFVPHVFAEFRQESVGHGRSYEGSGLGLAITKRLVELMGGQIWLESEPGRGSRFAFSLWLGVGEPKGARTVVPERLASLDVLVADDNPAASEVIGEALRTVVRTVTAVASGAEALAAIRRQDASRPYDLLFLDWRMPGMDGLATLQALRAVDARIEVIVATGYANVETAVACMKSGAYDYIQKPYDLAELKLLLERATQKGHLQDLVSLYEGSHALLATRHHSDLLDLALTLAQRTLDSDDSALVLEQPSGTALGIHRACTVTSPTDELLLGRRYCRDLVFPCDAL